VERGNVVIDGNGYVLQGIGNGNGFYWTSINNVTIKNTNIKGSNYGVSLDSSSGNTISGNIIAYGLEMWLCSNSVVSGNTMVNAPGFGVCLYFSSTNTISGNKITNNAGGIDLWYSDNNAISGNNITDNIPANYGIGVLLDSSDGNTVSGNNITNNRDFGILLYGYLGNFLLNHTISNNTISGNSITNNNCGVYLQNAITNNIVGNNISNNDDGVCFYNSSDNRFYHNNFVDNAEQVHFDTSGCINVWDDGYPSGGNYWTDYVGIDLHHGPFQNETGSDGIGDTPYIIDGDNQDNYPLMEPWSPIETVHATIDIDPDTLNLRSRGKWITCYIELPEGYNVSDIDVTSVMLNDTVPVYPKTHTIGDYDEDGIPDLMVKSDRAEVIDYIMANVNMTKLLEEKFKTVTLTITGKLDDGTPFQGNTKIRIIARAGLPKISTKISFTLSPNPATIGQTITLTGNLKSQLGNAISNAPVEVYYSIDNGRNWVHAGTIHTDSAGGFNAKGKLTIVGTFLIAVVYRGNFRYSQSYRIETLMIDSST
jgi:parallel beta-helix repeat protein